MSAGAFGGTQAAAISNALAVPPVSFTIDGSGRGRVRPDEFGAAIDRLMEGGDLILLEQSRFERRDTSATDCVAIRPDQGTS